MALGYPRYSTWKGVTMHLEDLIVTKSRRGNGIGSLLFSKFISYAHSLRVKRIEWAVLDWNVNAIKFYKKNGAKILSDWRVAQMDEDSIKKFCNNESI
jgi:GNAT superfamily N-acetyltransferase